MCPGLPHRPDPSFGERVGPIKRPALISLQVIDVCCPLMALRHPLMKVRSPLMIGAVRVLGVVVAILGTDSGVPAC